ncbi:MAG: hypothetical protein MZV64_08050 [Ignavibacteriales bacterium]|nr:hypothetical protein [Ignavibacteriales bacterium]
MPIGGLMQSGDGIAPEEIFLYEVASAGPPCPIDPPSNPSPASGTTDVPINGNTAIGQMVPVLMLLKYGLDQLVIWQWYMIVFLLHPYL